MLKKQTERRVEVSKHNNDDGFRWYHAIFIWMILGPLFLIAIAPTMFFKGWPIVFMILSVVAGVFLVLYVPDGKKKTNKTEEG